MALASTHLPLRDVADYITRDRVRDVLRVMLEDLQSKFGIAEPEIIVCGLNPHAGEGGHLGDEDAEVIAPVIDEFVQGKVSGCAGRSRPTLRLPRLPASGMPCSRCTTTRGCRC